MKFPSRQRLNNRLIQCHPYLLLLICSRHSLPDESMWQSVTHGTIHVSTRYRRCNRDQHDQKTISYQDKHGCWTSPCERPSQSKYRPTDQIPGNTELFVRNQNPFTVHSAQFFSLDPLNEYDAYYYRPSDHTIHMPRLNTKHLIYPKPTHQIRLRMNHTTHIPNH